MQESNTTFYKCSRCGNIIGLISGDINRIMCCGKKMDLLEANTEDASVEKHMPVYEKAGKSISFSACKKPVSLYVGCESACL